jgi:hypothetical protein
MVLVEVRNHPLVVGRHYTVVHASHRDAEGRMYSPKEDIEYAGKFVEELLVGPLFRQNSGDNLIEREDLTCFMEVERVY